MMFFIIAAAIVVGVASVCLGNRRQIKIEFSASIWDWIAPIMLAFAMYLVSFVLEAIVSKKLVNMVSYKNPIVGELIDAGILVALACHAISHVFKLVVEKANLDYMEGYSELVYKICYTIIIIGVGLVMIFEVCIPNMASSTYIVDDIENRIAMWIVTASGAWIGIGVRCESRVSREKKAKQAISRKSSRSKMLLLFSTILISLFCVILFWIMCANSNYIDIVLKYSFIFGLVMILFGVATNILLKFYKEPSEDVSRRRFLRAAGKYRNQRYGANKQISAYFGRNKYTIQDNAVFVEKIEVKYPNHDNDGELVSLFSERTIELTQDQEELVIDILQKRNREQSEYLRREREKCVDEARKSKLREC